MPPGAKLQSSHLGHTAMPPLDFDGDYGRTYASTIRHSIPGYDSLLEIGSAALAALAPQAATALIVGPGRGEELPGIFDALPRARFTLLEPSEQMRQGCADVIASAGTEGRCQLLEHTLEQAGALADEPFDVVICHHVLHLLPADAQRQALRQLTARLAPGGLLLLSSYSEPADAAAMPGLLTVAASRLRRLGMDGDTVSTFMAGRNSLVFSLDEARLSEELAAAGLEPPLRLQQALCSLLWVSRKP